MTGGDILYVVHGSNAHTWWRRMANGGYPWWRRWSLFCCEMRRAFGSECEILEFRWTGSNRHQARLDAGASLAGVIEREDSGRPVHVIGHSHGGNVALEAANRLPPQRIKTIVLLANPHMAVLNRTGRAPHLRGNGPPTAHWLYWGGAAERVERIWNLYSPEDRVQCLLARLFHGLPGTLPGALEVRRTYEGAGSGRVENGAVHWSNSRAAHSALHSASMGAVAGALLRGGTFTEAMTAAGLSLAAPNDCRDRGGWPGIQKTQELIRSRGNPRPFDIGSAQSKIAILFIHGFTASPSEMRPLAEALSRRSNWRCKGIVLPGHGSRIEDMRAYNGEDWIAAVEGTYDELALTSRHVFVAGLSLGGTLACHLAFRRRTDQRLRGLILLAPAFDISARRAIGLRLLRPLKSLKSKGARAADYFLDHKLYSYIQTPLNRAVEVLRLGRNAAERLQELRQVPLMLVAGDMESTVSLSRIHEVARLHPWIRFVRLRKSRHILTVEPDRETLFEVSAQFVEECVRNNETG